ncbi:hypothetical protein [Sphingobacterium corticibacter]|nr:hypothetical protein [Sphingobacterium corticibacter]
MKTISLFFFLLFALQHMFAQNYVDVAKVSYSSTQINYQGQSASSRMNAFDAMFLSPLQIAPSAHLLLGGDFNLRSLELNNNATDHTFYNAMLRLGVSKVFNPKWNGYIAALPKFASDYDSNFGSSLMLGGLAMLKRVRSENLTWKVGLYGSQEAYGFFGTPILGIFYRTPDEKLTIDASLPLWADANYALNNKKTTSVGLDFIAIRRSFFMGRDNADQRYVENNEISFTPYFQYAALESKLLLRLKAGYSATDFGLYSANDNKMTAISAININDDRTRLNQDIKGGLQVKIEATIRLGVKR